MSKPSKYLIGRQFYVSARLLSEANKRIECRNKVIIKTGIKQYMPIRSFLKVFDTIKRGRQDIGSKVIEFKVKCIFLSPLFRRKK